MTHLGMPEGLPHELDDGFEATFERLRRWFRSRGVPGEEAADLAQEAIARALIHLRRHGFDPEVGADPLLNTIGRNLLIDRARSLGPVVVPIEAAEFVDEGFDPSDEVARMAARRAVRAAIGTLSSRHRRAMLLTLDGFSPGEIADHFGIQRNAADALLHRARRRLADQLRATIGAALGWVAVIAVRARSGARRAAETARISDLVASGFVANVATAALAISMFGASIPQPDLAPAMLSGAHTRRAAPDTAIAPESHGVTADLVGHAADVGSPRAHRVEVERTIPGPVTGREYNAGARWWWQPDPEGNDGFTGPAIRAAYDAWCRLDVIGCDQ